MIEPFLIYNKTLNQFFLLGLMYLLTVSCSHKYNSDELDLGFYQWNMWLDDPALKDTQALKNDHALEAEKTPSCGWEDFHRGIGKLVRIPANFEAHFSDVDHKGVLWFHCRFTLPELWEHRNIDLAFESAGPGVEVYLNEKLVGSHQGSEIPFEFNITEQVYYTLDNHLSIRLTDLKKGSKPDSFGILGQVLVKSRIKEASSLE